MNARPTIDPLTLALLAGVVSIARGQASPPAPTPELAAATRPLGWLSDPGAPAADPFEAIVSGKIHLDNRLRVELADKSAANSSSAITNRFRLGYETKAFLGLSGLFEFENVSTPDEGNFFVPQTGGGTRDRTVVADPPGTEVNQVYARYASANLGGAGLSVDIRVGRQKIRLDDDRFIGNVDWRQFEQTYDGVSVRSDLGVKGLSALYAYVFRVNKIFGPDGPNPDSNSHFIHMEYRAAPEVTLIPFAHLLDFEADDPLNSSNSLGLRVTGKLWADPAGATDLYADYEFTYAHQQDAGQNPVDYRADFLAAQLRVTRLTLGHALVGYQFLGSDDGDFAFRFPLGTNHAFQGFADNFLVTPAVGLNDLYFGLGADLPLGIKASAAYHLFWSDEGGDDFGEEFDFVVSKQITPNWQVLIKGGFYDGDTGQPDISRFWVQTTVKF